jgi:hypothetical protein
LFTCPSPARADDASINITDSVVIKGSGSNYVGLNTYVTPGGVINPLDTSEVCPSSISSGFLVIGVSETLFQIGIRGANNNGIEVSIEDMSVSKVSQLAQIRDGAKLTLRNIE